MWRGEKNPSSAVRLPARQPAFFPAHLSLGNRAQSSLYGAVHLRCLAVVLLVCLAQAACSQEPGAPPKLLLDAGHCLVTAQGNPLNLASPKPAHIELGYSPDAKSEHGASLLTVVSYAVPTHARGKVFTFVVRGSDAHRTLELQYSIGFRQSVDGSQRLELIDPPFGGIATQDEALAAIRHIGFHTFTIPLALLLAPSESVRCESQPAVP